MKKILMIILILFFTLMKVDAQNRWEKLSGPVGGTIAGLTAKGNTLIAGTGFNKGLIFFSINGGKNWQEAKFKVSRSVTDFIFTNDGGVIASATTNGLFKSDNFLNWRNIFKGENFLYFGNYKQSIYAGSYNGTISKSTNNGENWDRAYSSMESIFNFAETSDSILFVGSMNKILRKNKNMTWEEISFPDTIGTNY